MNTPSLVQRLLLTAGLAAAVLGSALVTVSPAGADPPKPGQRAATPTPIPGAGPLTLPRDPKPVTTSAPAAPLTLDRVDITEVGGAQATLVVRGSDPTIMSYTLRRVDGAGDSTAGLPSSTYLAEHRAGLSNLKSNTTYEVAVYATNAAGQNAIATKRFTTSKQRVRVTLREINITDDGDWIGDGDPTWFLRLEWAGGKTGGCYPNNGNICETGSHGEGRIFPRNYRGQFLSWTFAEENFDTMPVAFKLSAAAQEYDLVPILPNALNCINLTGQCGYGSDLSYVTETWQVPAGREWASTPVSVHAYDGGKGFDSTMTFTFELFHDNLSYPSARNTPQSTWAE